MSRSGTWVGASGHRHQGLFRIMARTLVSAIQLVSSASAGHHTRCGHAKTRGAQPPVRNDAPHTIRILNESLELHCLGCLDIAPQCILSW